MIAAGRRQTAQARRRLILDEAMRMLGERGFNGLTVQALAEQCGISNAGLLYYFGSKDELLLAVLDEFERGEREVMTPLIEAFEVRRHAHTDRLQDAAVLLDRMAARFKERPEVARLLFVLQAEALDQTHPAHHWFRRREQMTLDLCSSLLKPFVPNSLATSRHLVASMHGLGQHWLRQDMAFNLVEEWRSLSALILAPHGKAKH